MSKKLTTQERQRAAARNRIRCTVALPADVELDFIDWVPGKAELAAVQRRKTAQRRLEYLDELKAEWERSDLLAMQRKAAELAVVIAQDKIWLARESAWEAKVESVRNYFLTELQREEKAADKARLERLRKAAAAINRDICKTEREVLIRRGAYRGR